MATGSIITTANHTTNTTTTATMNFTLRITSTAMIDITTTTTATTSTTVSISAFERLFVAFVLTCSIVYNYVCLHSGRDCAQTLPQMHNTSTFPYF